MAGSQPASAPQRASAWAAALASVARRTAAPGKAERTSRPSGRSRPAVDGGRQLDPVVERDPEGGHADGRHLAAGRRRRRAPSWPPRCRDRSSPGRPARHRWTRWWTRGVRHQARTRPWRSWCRRSRGRARRASLPRRTFPWAVPCCRAAPLPPGRHPLAGQRPLARAKPSCPILLGQYPNYQVATRPRCNRLATARRRGRRRQAIRERGLPDDICSRCGSDDILAVVVATTMDIRPAGRMCSR